jgi:hypothetical protein
MAAGATYTSIATTTTSGSASSVSLNSFSGYTDLVLIINFSLSTNAEVYIRFNGDTNANYARVYMEGNGTSASSAQSNDAQQINILGRSSQMVNIVNLMNYSNTSTFKNVVARFSSPSEIVGGEVGLWRSTSAITSITISLSSGNFTNGSVISLYGITQA